MTPRSDVLITAEDLMARLAAGEAVSILDVRWQLSEPDGSTAYRQGHIPGAVYVSLEDELSDHSVTGRGRHPLPTGQAVAAARMPLGPSAEHPGRRVRRLEPGGFGRAWWVLTAAGLPASGSSTAAWRLAVRGGALDTDVPQPPPGDVPVPHEDLYAARCRR